MADETIHCRRCGKDAPRLARPPFRNELGERIAAEICADCWKDWLQHQTLLINHYGLDPRDAKARTFLYEQIEQVLLRDEAPEQVDTSQKGNIEW
jgi:Fe-S cluster biosynthesis and repair protein YggX